MNPEIRHYKNHLSFVHALGNVVEAPDAFFSAEGNVFRTTFAAFVRVFFANTNPRNNFITVLTVENDCC